METVNIKEILNMFWSKKYIILIIVVICTLLGVYYTKEILVPQYKTSVSLVLVKSGEEMENKEISQSDLTLNQKLIATYTELIKSKSVLRQVIDKMHIKMTEAELKNSITVQQVNNTEFMRITIVGKNAQHITEMANNLATIFKEEVYRIYSIDNIHIVDEAEIPQTPYNVSPIKDIIIFFGIGLVISFLYVIILNSIDSTVKDVSDIEKYIGLSVLVSIPNCDIEAKEERGKKNESGTNNE